MRIAAVAEVGIPIVSSGTSTPEGGVVGRLRPGDALDGALAELLTCAPAREPALERPDGDHDDSTPAKSWSTPNVSRAWPESWSIRSGHCPAR
jgi:hypothetical protein